MPNIVKKGCIQYAIDDKGKVYIVATNDDELYAVLSIVDLMIKFVSENVPGFGSLLSMITPAIKSITGIDPNEYMNEHLGSALLPAVKDYGKISSKSGAIVYKQR